MKDDHFSCWRHPSAQFAQFALRNTTEGDQNEETREDCGVAEVHLNDRCLVAGPKWSPKLDGSPPKCGVSLLASAGLGFVEPDASVTMSLVSWASFFEPYPVW